MILPISINERMDFFRSLGSASISEEVIKILANNYNIYYKINSSVFRLMYIKDNKLLQVPHACKSYDYYYNINQPFIIYELYDKYLRGCFVQDYMSDINYKDFITKSGIHRNNLLTKILDSF